MTTKKKHTYCALFVKALFPRFLFLGHGIICIWLLGKQENNSRYWYLAICLGLLVLEGIFNVLVRHGKEFHWFCPSAFLYCVVLIVSLTVLRERQIQCSDGSTYCQQQLYGNNPLSNLFNGMAYSKRVSLIEQTGLLVLIVGRWLLPQGHISRQQFSQILLIYIGTAADIVEFSEIYGEDDLKKLKKDKANVLHGVMAVWAWSVLQFSLTIALPEEGLKEEEVEEEEDEELFEEKSYFRTKIQNKVAPMSYMHYKSMMREGFQTKNGAKLKRTPTVAQIAFQKRYENTSKTLNSLHHRTSPSEQSLGGRKFTDPPKTARFSIGSPVSMNSRRSRYTTESRVVTLPDGERVPRNVGSPVSIRATRRNVPSSESSRSNKLIGSPQSTRSNRLIGSPESIRSTRSQTSSTPRQNKLSTQREINVRKKSAWQRFVRNVSMSNKRKKEKKIKRRDSIKEDNSLGIGKKEVQNCFVKYLDLIGILLPVCMQDGPFFIFRFVLVAHYQVVTEMIILLTTKNALVVIIQIYRILIMYCSEPKKDEPDIEDASVRVRTAMDSNKKISAREKTHKASIAIQAISRMQTLFREKQNDEINLSNGQSNRQANGDVILDMPQR